MKYDSFTLDEARVHVYNEVTIVIGRQVQNGAYHDNSIQRQFRITLVFVTQQGQWRLASLHLSPIGQAPNFNGNF